MKIIADESVNFRFVKLLRAQGFEIYAIGESNVGISDTDVVKIAQKENSILITEDKDFGELVFAHQIKETKIVFLRYEKEEEEKKRKVYC